MTTNTIHEPLTIDDEVTRVRAQERAMYRGQLAKALGVPFSSLKWDQLIEAVGKGREEANAKSANAKSPGGFGTIDAAIRELAEALGVDKSNSHGAFTWPELIAKVADLAVTDCAPASQAEQMLWQLAEALGIPGPTPATWNAMLDEVRTLANPETGAAKRAPSEDRMLHAEQVIRQLVDARADDQASLRAEFTALGKHLEDVERRAYMSPTGEALAALEGRHVARMTEVLARLTSLEGRVETEQQLAGSRGLATTALGRINALDQRIDPIADEVARNRDVLRDWVARVDALEDSSAGKAETLEAVRSLTDAIQALASDLDIVRQRLGNDPQPAHDRITDLKSELRGLAKLVEPGARFAAPDPEAELRAVRPRKVGPVPGYMQTLEDVRDWLKGVGGTLDRYNAVTVAHCVSVLDGEIARQATMDAPLDLATLRVRCAEDPWTDYARVVVGQGQAFGSLYLHVQQDMAKSGLADSSDTRATIALRPDAARLLARALTQWADSAEKGAGK